MEDTERSKATTPASAPRWDLTGMTSAYCNLAAATATRDSVAVHLGVTQKSEREPGEVKPELLHCIVLAPRTAKHLHQIIGTLLGEYEAQRGGPG